MEEENKTSEDTKNVDLKKNNSTKSKKTTENVVNKEQNAEQKENNLNAKSENKENIHKSDEFIDIPDDLKEFFPTPIKKVKSFSEIENRKGSIFNTIIPKEIEHRLEKKEGYKIVWPLMRNMYKYVEKGYDFVIKKSKEGKSEKIKIYAGQSHDGQADYHVAMKIKKEFLEKRREMDYRQTMERIDRIGNKSTEEHNEYFDGINISPHVEGFSFKK